MAENILLICAHPDDQILGAGATLAKHVANGDKVYTLMYSYGETSKPHIKEDVIKENQERDAKAANKELGGEGIEFLGIHEAKIAEDAPNHREKVKDFIESHEPSKIYTHVPEDPAPDHSTVGKEVLTIVEELGLDVNVYGFDKWALFRLKRRDYPRTVVTISGYFRQKMKALSELKSQKFTLFIMKLSAYIRAFANSFRNNMRLAEVFYRLK